MRMKWHYVMVPACISFGPLLMTNLGGLSNPGWGWVISLLGTLQVTIALGIMFSMINEQRVVIERLSKQNTQAQPASV
jgi:hypothetical protein